MNQRKLSTLLKVIILALAICGLVMYTQIFPIYGHFLIDKYPDFKQYYLPWLIFLWTTGIPCYVILYDTWNIACNISKNDIFVNSNAMYLKRIAIGSLADGIIFFAGNIVLFLLGQLRFETTFFSVFGLMLGILISTTAALLSHFVYKAAELQEESDLTV